MSKIDVFSGEWIGYFEYDQTYGELYEGKRVELLVSIEYNKGDFTGISREIAGFGPNPNNATINGFIQDNTISFIKKYPFYYEVDENGNVSFDKDKEHPEISYFGEYIEQEQLFKGEWEVEIDGYMEGDQYISLVYTGTWELRKK